MKNFAVLRCITWMTALVLLVGLSGCAAVPTTTTAFITAPNLPPTDPANVAILSAQPTQPCEKLGEIRAEPASSSTSKEEIRTALQNAGAKLGADAVVIVHDQTQTIGAIMTGPWYDRSLDQIQGRVIIGIAIKYTPAVPTPAGK